MFSCFAGSYFAQDANYSYKFTDHPTCSRQRPGLSVNSLITSLINVPSLNLAPVPPQPPLPYMGLTHPLQIRSVNTGNGPSWTLTTNGNTVTFSNGMTVSPVNSGPLTTQPQAQLLSQPQLQQPVAAPPEEVYNAAVAGWQSETAMNPTLGHSRIMFVARVLVGLYSQGRPCMRKPPPLDQKSPYGRCYDSCVNDLCDPRIYVIFDSAQCFPEYIIEFQN